MLNYECINSNVRHALAEDLGSGDVSAGLLAADLVVTAELISREAMLVAGIPWVEEVFTYVNSSTSIEWHVTEGQWLDKGQRLATINGNGRAILTAERCALNFLQTLSATATQTYYYLQQLKGTSTRLLDTRKTIPGLRYGQKYAVACAGGVNHRMGLYDAFLIKENHIRAHGSITAAIQQARAMNADLMLEVEVETLAELQEALIAKPDRIMLDNFTEADIVQAVKLNQTFNIPLEASGGITLANIRKIALLGVDFISVGAITKSIQAIDLSLLVKF